MYTNVSEEFAEKIASHSRTFRAKLIFSDSEITEGIYSVKVKGGSCATKELKIGSTVSATVDIDIAETKYSFKNKRFELQIGLLLDSGNVEFVPCGVYHIRTATTKDGKTTLSAADAMHLADRTYKTALTFPAPAVDVVNEICKTLRVQQSVDGLDGIVLPYAPSTKATMREVLGKIAALVGKNALFDRNGELVFKWYEESGFVTDYAHIDNPDIDEESFTVSYLMCNVTDKIIKIYGDEFAQQGISISNEFVLDSLENAWEQIGGFSYRPVNVKMRLGDIRLDPWDVFTIDCNGELIKSIPMSLSFDYDGGLSCTVSATVPDTDKDYKSPSEIQAEKQKEKDENSSLVITASNLYAVDVGASEQKLLELPFSTSRESLPFINATVQLEETTPGVVTLLLKLNGSVYSAYRISANEGYNLMSFSSAFAELSAGSQELELYITGSGATVQPKQASVILTGYGLVAQASWNGLLNFNDVIEAVVRYVYKTAVMPIESSIDITTITPDTLTVSDEVGATVHKWAILPDITEAVPYDIISVSNPTNDTVEFLFSNAVFMRSVGGVELDSFALTGFKGTTPTAITVHEAGLEKPFAENLVDLSGESWEISDGKLISSAVGVDEVKSYTATFIVTTEPYTEESLERFTESQLDFYREIEVEGRQYNCTLIYYNPDGEQIESVGITDYYQLEIPEGATAVRFEVAETTGREITADDIVCFYVKLEEGTESTIFRFSNKVVLRVDDLSQFESSINFAIGETGLLNPFTNEVINTVSSGSFTRKIHEEVSDV